MTAKVGTAPFFSPAAREAEDTHRMLISEMMHNDKRFSWYQSRTVADLIGKENIKYSYKQNNDVSEIRPDGGFMYYNSKLVGVAENKFQESSQNAIERTDKYLKINQFRLQPFRIFLSCYGEGFRQKPGRSMGAVGVYLDMAFYAGFTILLNPTDDEFRKTYLDWLERIKE